jgi:hypothetical protein
LRAATAPRERGELIHLAPGEERRYRLEVGALTGPDAIDTFARQNTALAAEVQTPACPRSSQEVSDGQR